MHFSEYKHLTKIVIILIMLPVGCEYDIIKNRRGVSNAARTLQEKFLPQRFPL